MRIYPNFFIELNFAVMLPSISPWCRNMLLNSTRNKNITYMGKFTLLHSLDTFAFYI